MNIEEEEKKIKDEKEEENADKQGPLSMRERLFNAMQNGLENDVGPQDASFALLFLNASLTEIINKYVFEYYNNQLFNQVLFEKPTDLDLTDVILKDLAQRVKKEQSFVSLLSSILEHFAGSGIDKASLEFIANESVSRKLEAHYSSFIQTKILKHCS